MQSNLESKLKEHLEIFKNSNSSLSEYCKTNKLKYHQLRYWLKKQNKSKPALIPVRLKVCEKPTQEVLCKLKFGQDVQLEVYNSQVLEVILERFI